MRLGSLAALLEWHDDLPTLCSAEVNTSPRSFVTASDFKAERLGSSPIRYAKSPEFLLIGKPDK